MGDLQEQTRQRKRFGVPWGRHIYSPAAKASPRADALGKKVPKKTFPPFHPMERGTKGVWNSAT